MIPIILTHQVGRRESSEPVSTSSSFHTPSPSVRSLVRSGQTSKKSSSIKSSADEWFADYFAVEAAREARKDFLPTLPPSLLAKVGREEGCKHQHDAVAPFTMDEVVLGPRLGSGEYSHVYEVASFALLRNDGSRTAKEMETRLRMKNTEKYRQTNNARYALKHLKESYLKENGVDEYVQAAV